jgi:hypothetical protein
MQLSDCVTKEDAFELLKERYLGILEWCQGKGRSVRHEVAEVEVVTKFYQDAPASATHKKPKKAEPKPTTLVEEDVEIIPTLDSMTETGVEDSHEVYGYDRHKEFGDAA